MRILAQIACLLGLTATAAAQGADANKVDLELVLAVDISYSMDYDELYLQREGYILALTSKEVLDAIRQGVYGRIAVAYVEWAGAAQQTLLIDWHLIDGPESARIFADQLSESGHNRAYRTSISGGLQFSSALFAENDYEGSRQVIDISGDGPNNQGSPVTLMRDQVVAKGIGINGLPLILKDPNAFSLDVQNLEAYYRDCVIGGPGAFVIPIEDKLKFTEAIRTKLVLEIAGREPPPRVIPVESQPADCLIGERIWRDRYGEGVQDWQ